jgi:putative hemolysin
LGLNILTIILFLILSAFFSGSETAFFSLTKVQMKQIEKKGTSKSRRISRLLGKPRELLILILLGNTIVNVAAASVAAIITIEISNRFFVTTPHMVLIFVEIILMTFILLIFGELSPKLLAFAYPEKFAGFSSFFLILLRFILWPIIKFLELISNLFTKSGFEIESKNITSEDLRNIIHSKATQHSLEENEKRIIASIFKFSSTTAREILIPRVDIVAIEAAESIESLKKLFFESGHSKIPVFKKNIDTIIGIVYAKDVILNPEKKSISSLLRSPIFITENTMIQSLLNQFKIRKVQIAIVVDEYGGTSGLITLEDIMEELVGEIMDEYDNEKPKQIKLSDNEYLISGMYSISDVNSEFLLDIDEELYDNLAEFIFDNFNKIPRKNESFVYDNKAEFIIANISSQRIKSVRLKLLNQPHEV